MSQIYQFLKTLTLLASALCLSQCAHRYSSQANQANQANDSPYTMPAANYLAQANSQEGIAKQELEINAAGRLVNDGDWQQAHRLLAKLKRLPTELNNQKNILLAKIASMREQPRTAIHKLANIRNAQSMSLYNQIQYHEMLASAYRTIKKPAEAVTERIKLEELLPDNNSRLSNLRALWLTVTTLNAAEINTFAMEAPDNSELKGWMELGLISREEQQSPQNMVKQIENWKSNYPTHPALNILSTVNRSNKLFNPPQKIALLLPLSGGLAEPGKAIEEGFMSAYNKASSNIEVKSYDTAVDDIVSLYQKALNDGANYIVGPLSKANTTKIAALNHPVPTLVLNEINNNYATPNLYQFGISPYSEAMQVATKARKNGHTKALIIAPIDSWGDQITNAFTQQWHTRGGQVVDSLRYSQNEDLNNAIRNLLLVSDSEARVQNLKNILGKKLQSTPRRRQDFDMIFLLAYPSKARQIMPLLRYYYAGNTPTYSISTVYAGNSNTIKDRDLNGIIFCDMPWVFSNKTSHKNWPEQWNSYNRLFALGMDTFELSTQLNRLLLFPAMGVNDNSGVLYLSNNQQIGRILTWGKFQHGLATPIYDA